MLTENINCLSTFKNLPHVITDFLNKSLARYQLSYCKNPNKSASCRMDATLGQDLRKAKVIYAAQMVTNRNSAQETSRCQVDFCTKRFLNPRVTMIFLDLYQKT